jgi:hypothetical protein
MRPFSTHRPSRASLAWLVWLALLLPIAQYASALHGLSHAVAQSQGEDKQAAHFAHCDLCATAAEVAAGALPGLAPTLLPPLAQYAAPVFADRRAHHARTALPYRSRAPPFAPH